MSKNDKKNKLAKAIIILVVIAMLIPIVSVVFSLF
jgi:hypothetical protein